MKNLTTCFALIVCLLSGCSAYHPEVRWYDLRECTDEELENIKQALDMAEIFMSTAEPLLYEHWETTRLDFAHLDTDLVMERLRSAEYVCGKSEFKDPELQQFGYVGGMADYRDQIVYINPEAYEYTRFVDKHVNQPGHDYYQLDLADKVNWIAEDPAAIYELKDQSWEYYRYSAGFTALLIHEGTHLAFESDAEHEHSCHDVYDDNVSDEMYDHDIPEQYEVAFDTASFNLANNEKDLLSQIYYDIWIYD